MTSHALYVPMSIPPVLPHATLLMNVQSFGYLLPGTSKFRLFMGHEPSRKKFFGHIDVYLLEEWCVGCYVVYTLFFLALLLSLV
ncbi:hypothetical protein ASPBRDRAFT_612362 [Aspergillus brasiliensis CBS 101740]|uniref:Uncharacterized protein n=1 Tax=Aspergillus brasiliensis (strain CBS 101740 / IMI 381727 / IBT 21946) TaxID=767769 RepID=A0A1L9UIA4_ASPBC|nr:hypothetical protein ASPBRDRAFT_612362 [Aspergillus brasiliensis CBS 101740]